MRFKVNDHGIFTRRSRDFLAENKYTSIYSFRDAKNRKELIPVYFPMAQRKNLEKAVIWRAFIEPSYGLQKLLHWVFMKMTKRKKYALVKMMQAIFAEYGLSLTDVHGQYTFKDKEIRDNIPMPLSAEEIDRMPYEPTVKEYYRAGIFTQTTDMWEGAQEHIAVPFKKEKANYDLLFEELPDDDMKS